MMSFLFYPWCSDKISVQDSKAYYLGSTRIMSSEEAIRLIKEIFPVLSKEREEKILKAWKDKSRFEVSIDISMKPFEYTVSLEFLDTRKSEKKERLYERKILLVDEEPPKGVWKIVRGIYDLYKYPVENKEILNEFVYLRSDDLGSIYKELKSKGFRYIRPKRVTPNPFPSREGEAVRNRWLVVPGEDDTSSAYCGICKKTIISGGSLEMIVCNSCRKKLLGMTNPKPDDVYDIFVGSRKIKQGGKGSA